MKALKFFSTALFLLLSSGLFQEACGADLFVMFRPNLVNTEKLAFTKGQVTTNEINSNAIVGILNKYGCAGINATVPKGWADTIAYAPDGSIIKMLDLSRIYRLKIDDVNFMRRRS